VERQHAAGESLMRNLFLTTVFVAAAHTAAATTACDVLTPGDVAAVQGQRYSDAKLTETTVRGLAVSQCFYQLPAFTKSVSVDIYRGNGVAEFWRDLEENVGRDEGEKAGAEREGGTGVPIAGVGDEAVWSATKIAGALYVRKGNSILRISVGGPGTEEEKIEKSKRLAAKALARM
jgi:hypothetical protein